jgi:DNA-binding NtrC family response regulator
LALAQAGSNLSKAAKLLGISRPTLYDLMQQHQIGVDVSRLLIEERKGDAPGSTP